MNHEIIIVLDFGGQNNQLITRCIRENNVYCEVKSYKTDMETIIAMNPKGIILTGGPGSVYEKDAPSYARGLFERGIPTLGIGFGAQLLAHMFGGDVSGAEMSEHGSALVTHNESSLFDGVEKTSPCLMSNDDKITGLPLGFEITASAENCAVAAFENKELCLYGVQFHPEAHGTECGAKILSNFLFNICKCSGDWEMSRYAKEYIANIRQKIGDKKVLCALSGGVDSAVAAVIISRAVGRQLTCIFVDTGLLRKDEGDQVEEIFGKQFDLNLIRVNAQERFLKKLAGVRDPERKRKIIGEEFIRVFEEEAKKIGAVDFLVQGTIYPDVIESGTDNGAVIKSHHNVGGLPEHVDFKEIIEPLRSLFKDEVRKLGTELGIPEALVWRQPFPGPGLAVRVIGEITEEKLLIVREADAIFREEIALAKLDRDINQYFAVITDMRSVGVTGDERTYDYTLALRAVKTTDFMTADWAEIPAEILRRTSGRIVNEVEHVNRVVYDITSKPPATIEWE